MIRVTVEIVRFGDEAQRKVAETVYIGNDGTGDHEDGHYAVYLRDPRKSRINPAATFDHHRPDGLLKCVQKALEAL